MKLIYCKEGIANPDYLSETLAKELIDNRVEEYKTSTESLILAFRVLLHEKIINIKDIEIIYEGEKVKLFENGRITEWIEGFCDVADEFYNRLLDLNRGL